MDLRGDHGADGGFRDGRAPRRATLGQAAACGARLGADATQQQISTEGPCTQYKWGFP